ncbi:MAG TPA: DUF4382 domain-containing protein [bacterium]|nr:DUF4382 domain-containing protein [bacterium]
MKTIHPFFFLAVVAVIVVFGYACQNDDDDDSGGDADFTLVMIDAPVDDAEAINLTVEEVAVHAFHMTDNDDDATDDDATDDDGNADESGWFTLDVEPARYNLLELQNNAEVVLAEQTLPSGDYNEIRLILTCEGDDAPEIVIDGESKALTVPSGCQSGFKLKGQFTLAEGAQTKLIMDFDMRKSVHETGNDKYLLSPVVRLIQADAAGTITGEISPAVPRAIVYVFATGTFTGDNFDDAENSTIVRDDGSFVLAALPAGVYDLVVSAAGYEVKIYLEGYTVEAGVDHVLDAPLELTPSE